MQYAMKVFQYEDNDQFRVIDRNGEPWFVLREVCGKLGIANPPDAASRLDDDEKDAIGITDGIGRSQRTIVINESGLYSIILRSSKPEAKRFKKWITSEVLPSIRKTGSVRGGGGNSAQNSGVSVVAIEVYDQGGVSRLHPVPHGVPDDQDHHASRQSPRQA